MKSLARWAASLTACLALVAPGAANNDCCWDWNPAPGANSSVFGAVQLSGSPARPGAPNGWSQCTGAAENGSGKQNCLMRQGRQGFKGNSLCVLGSLGPNGTPPSPNLPWGAGFRCDPKVDGPGLFLQRIVQVTSPLGQQGTIFFEIPASLAATKAPTLGQLGSVVMALLLVGAGAWMLRRRGPRSATIG